MPSDESHRPLLARDLMHDLDARVASGRRSDILASYTAAIEPLYGLIASARGPHAGNGEQGFAMMYLAARSITDLITAGHLASHAYVQQAYTVLRPVHESCDLIQLFAASAQEASRWVNSARPGQEFRPADVRRKVGAPPEATEMYGHLSEMGTHPRFTGSRAAALMRVKTKDPSVRSLVIRMGSFFEWHPATVHVFVFAFEGVTRLALTLQHLSLVTREVTLIGWMEATVSSFIAAARGQKLIREELIALDAGDASEYMDTIYDEIVDQFTTQLEALRATEPTTRERL